MPKRAEPHPNLIAPVSNGLPAKRYRVSPDNVGAPEQLRASLILIALAMPPEYEILNHFSAPNGHLAEIKRLDQPVDASTFKVYQWLWLEAGAVTTLQFIAMETSPRQVRTFEEARLWFDNVQGELQWRDGPAIPLVVQTAQALPGALRARVDEHLS